MSWPWSSALLSGVLLLSACGSAPTTRPGPAEPDPTRSTQPSSARSSADIRDADPCGFLRSERLARFGAVTVKEGFYFTLCEAELTTATGKVNLYVELQPKVSDMGAGNSPLVPVTRAGRQVFGFGSAPRSYGCLRDISVSEHAVVKTRLWAKADYDCKMADDIADEWVGQINDGDVPALSQPANSLARQDACRLLERPEAARVPGIDLGEFESGFRGETCNWGDSSVTSPHLLVSLSREEPPAVRPGKADTAITIGGRPAVRTIVPRDEYSRIVGPSLGGCEVKILYRPLDGDVAKAEVLAVSIGTEGAEESMCPLVTEFATTALNRLPG
jgi:hypothetical protein